ncbi:M24 family metallopeptidase [Brevibacillus centrosporus]|uniref:M24 family metallopeptidase n=1 Tax=Brevibacillus centrosporus TaxID=54910 RepID=UPI003986F931
MSHPKRLEMMQQLMNKHQLTAIVLSSPTSQHYVSGYKAITYSRPLFYVLSQKESAFIVPGLEEEHARHVARVDRVIVYYEHPEQAHQGTNPVTSLLSYLQASVPGGKLGVEFNAVSIKVEKALIEAGWELVDVSDDLLGARVVKDAEELDLLRSAGKMVSLAVRASLEAVAPGVTELEIDQQGHRAALEEVSRLYPNTIAAVNAMTPSGVVRTVMPHVYSNTRRLEKGDILIHTHHVVLNGYIAECERTCFSWEASDSQKEAFSVMLAAQQAAFATIKAGVPMCDVDLAARAVIQNAGFGDYAIHRTGHSMGLDIHEPPFFRFDEKALLQEGMVFTVEPGFYVPGLGGFRHSDTVIITKDGYELVTNVASDLESMIL